MSKTNSRSLDTNWRIIISVLGVIALQGLLSDISTSQTLSSEPSSSTQEVYSTSAFPSNYLLGPGDQVGITVLGYEEYTESYIILPDGTITLPLLGSITVSSSTISELTQELTARLNEYLVDPSVTVTLVELRPVVVTVAGEVDRPGPLQLRSFLSGDPNDDSETQTPTVSLALSQAGGITSDADIQQIIVSRPLGNGEVATTTVNLWDALVSSNPSQDLILQDGDSIFVPELSGSSEINRRLLADSALAPSTIPVRVIGEVNTPGQVQVPPNSTISSALAIAGGPTEDARLSKVAFIRLNEAGEVEREIVDLQNLTDTYQVQEGDVIIVPKQTDASFLDFAARVLGPFGALINVFSGIDSLF